MRVRFTKCHGSGNDFPLVDARGLAVADAEWAAVARALSDRAGPVGGDGLLLLTEGSDGAAFGMRMMNPDGSEAETCLNGLRCVARAGFEALGLDAARVSLRTSVAEVRRAGAIGAGVCSVEERAGPAGLDVREWPMRLGVDRVVDAVVPPLSPTLSPTLRFTAVSMPNPHLVAFTEAVDEAELVRVGLLCESAPDWLPNRANVSFVEERAGGLFVRTHERGAGLTAACGSAMAASVVAAGLTGRVAWGTPITVWNLGGPVRAVAEADGVVTLTGNATFEWEGEVEVDLDAGVARDLSVSRRFDEEVAAWARLLAGPEAARAR